MAAIAGQAKTFNNCSGLEKGFWQFKASCWRMFQNGAFLAQYANLFY